MTISSNNAHCHAAVRLAELDTLREHIGVETTELYIDAFEARLEEVLRPVDRLIKLDDGSYCLLFRDLVAKNLVELAAAKLQRVLETPVEIINERLFFKFNAGFAAPDGAARRPQEVLRAAQAALRRAIAADLPCVVAADAQAPQQEPDEMLLPRIERALERGEFTLFYQAKVSSAYRNVVGAEGLVRWLDEDKSTIIGPGEFIPLAERSGLIKPLTEYLIREAVSRCRSWAAPMSVAVNLPPVMLQHRELQAMVGDALDVHGLEPERLTLEVTERGALPPTALKRLEELRALGLKVSIDDFGTGQSSISYLRDLPADQIKIDRSFVEELTTSEKDRGIVRGCIDLAHHCGIEAVAEGIEDAQTADMLTDMGCDVLQGFWFGKPVPAGQFEKEHLQGALAEPETDFFAKLLRRR